MIRSIKYQVQNLILFLVDFLKNVSVIPKWNIQYKILVWDIRDSEDCGVNSF